jgi:hypothetical protein
MFFGIFYNQDLSRRLGVYKYMSETPSLLTVIAFVIGLIPGLYFAYMLLRGLYIYLISNDEDILE